MATRIHSKRTVQSTLGSEITISSDVIDDTALVTLEADMREGLVDLTPAVARRLSALLAQAATEAERQLAQELTA